MRCQYVIQPGDTFENIAIQFYNNPHLATKLRQYNGLHNPDFIIIGQPIDIPASLDLAPQADEHFPAVQSPQAYQQMLDMFGNIYDYIDEDSCFDENAWSADMLTMAQLPFPVALSWDHSRQIRRVRCHKKMVGVITEAFSAIQHEGFVDEVITLGDFYNFRSKRTSGKLSTHCWGISFDVNPEINILGTKGCISGELVSLLEECGFTWGGNMAGTYKDPMHFQFCRGY